MPQFHTYFGTFSPTLQGLVVSAILITGAIFSLAAGYLSDRISRTYTIGIGSFLFAVGSAIFCAAPSLPLLFLGRCIAGAGEGLFLSTITVYTCEIAPTSIRGTLASIVQLFVTFGVASGYFVCYGTVRLQGTLAWRLPYGLQAVVATTLAVGAPLLPHSPRWLRAVGRHSDAANGWRRLGVSPAEAEKEEDTVNREASQHQELVPPTGTSHSKGLRIFGGLFAKDVRYRTLLGCFLMGMNQASGIDGVLYYAPILFTQAGLSATKASFLASGVTGIVNIVCTIGTMMATDRWGRRPATIGGGFTIAACFLVIGSVYASHGSDTQAGRWAIIILIYVFVVAFSVTWAVYNRIYASEIQPKHTRSAATSLGQSVNWIVNFIIALTTPLFLARSSSGPYFLFGGCTLVTALVCLAFQPESKGVSLEDFDEVFRESPWKVWLHRVRGSRAESL
ncbi:general substrate transporter [Gautieria morchelliformis]|nr:general substrate transporter [Gautieria morchelliformis]